MLNVRTRYETMCRSCKKVFFSLKKNDDARHTNYSNYTVTFSITIEEICKQADLGLSEVIFAHCIRFYDRKFLGTFLRISLLVLQGRFVKNQIIQTISNHCRRKEIVSGDDKEIFFERHYFLRLQKQFPEKWGEAHAPLPAPRVSTALATAKSVGISFPPHLFTFHSLVQLQLTRVKLNGISQLTLAEYKMLQGLNKAAVP